jgi:hypothetical protein
MGPPFTILVQALPNFPALAALRRTSKNDVRQARCRQKRKIKNLRVVEMAAKMALFGAAAV